MIVPPPDRHPWAVAALGLLLAAALLGGCGERRSRPKARKAALANRGAPQRQAEGSLGPLFERVPAEAQWAVAIRALGPASVRLQELLGLLGEHPALAPELRRIRALLEQHLGLWPFEAEGHRALGLREDTPVVVYRLASAAGAPGPGPLALLVGGSRPTALARAIADARQRRFRQPPAPARPSRVGGRLLLPVAERWTCGFERGWTRCLEAPPEAWGAAAAPDGGLRRRALGALRPSDLDGDVGFYLARLPGRLPASARLLLGVRPRGLLAVATLRSPPRLTGVLLGALPSAKAPGSHPCRPAESGRASGLGAMEGADLVARLCIAPADLPRLLRDLGPAGREAAALLAPEGPDAGAGLLGVLSGKVVLQSGPAGIGALVGLRDPAAAERALATLDLRLARRLPDWQRRVRELGPGWNLLPDRQARMGSVRHGLVLHLPRGAGSLFPQVRDQRIALYWGPSRDRLVLATDPAVFRRLRARVAAADAAFFGAPGGAARRRTFAPGARLSAALRPDDPSVILPLAQRGALRRLLGDGGPTWRAAWRGLRVASDLLLEVDLRVAPHPAGARLEATLVLPGGPGASREHAPWFDPRFRETLRRKWGGNTSGQVELLRELARDEAAGELAEKARRNLPAAEPTLRSGLIGLAASALAPWALRQRRQGQREEASRHLAELARALGAVARAAQAAPAATRRRWHRGLATTPLTPARQCCASPDRDCRSEPVDWRHPTWRRLGFALTGRHRYRYEVIVEPGSVRTQLLLRAVGDLDCDGRSSLLEVPASVEAATGALTLGRLRAVREEPRPAP